MNPDDSAARQENREWMESLDEVLQRAGPERAGELLREIQIHAQARGVRLPYMANTPYVNTIQPCDEPAYPGDRELERRIKSIIRWNAMAMVVRANRDEHGIGGHISTYASAATLYEVGFNHFFRGKNHPCGGDFVFFQGHSAPGIYARAFLEGRLEAAQLENYRRELRYCGGLASYPHPWLMPDFWSFPTVSMGLGPIMAIYQARFCRYLEDRGLKPATDMKVWAFLGDGETDEPETLGMINLAAREKLDNLIFVINCNLQRLDGPVRGNGKIVQELEAGFRGEGWNVIKVIWGDRWEPLLARDAEGALVRRMGEVVDGEFQKYIVSGGKYIRDHFFGADPRLLEMVKDYPDDQLRKLNRGGHDPKKVHAAYKAAMETRNAPTVILAHTVKGYGLGESGEGKNITHQQKQLNEEEMRNFRTRFGIPISDEEIAAAPFYRPAPDSAEIRYLKERRQALGGWAPIRRVSKAVLNPPEKTLWDEFYQGTQGREISTTMGFVRILAKLLKDRELGRLVVPIVPDEARTFGMEALFRQCGIYSHVGQLYEPVDAESLLYYKEVKDGQILEEGISEAGGMSSFIAAGTAYANHGVQTIPFFIYYSMFGFQRVGDLIWAAGDMRCRGFLIGGTAGRTTLAGEGLQHQDGHSHLLAYPLPNLMAYDPACVYELAVIIKDGLCRMYEKRESIFYYLTVMNENYAMPPMPKGAEEGILKGAYLFNPSPISDEKRRVQLLGSGAILNETVKAQRILAEKYGVAANVWSVTSYKELRQDALNAERWNMFHPGEKPHVPYVTDCFPKDPGVFVAASDYVKDVPNSIAPWLPGPLLSLGTNGFGRSDSRERLRDFFEVDARYIVIGALFMLARRKVLDAQTAKQAIDDLQVDPEKINPMLV
ncbi:MAG: pyruvate dehydrogenase (acetyl-transferring), homodimeric type [Verrucomicrobiae bacterium]|nr:pyruvate dehydrogenase (acetyl-transferring), homodimeric type [Verrucomicrobiae bacterium]